MREFEVFEHTADAGIRAYGSSLEELFANCALGMVSLILDPATVRRVDRVELRAEGMDRESLLVGWLSEILFRIEAEGRAFGAFEVAELGETRVRGWARGEPLDPERHHIETEVKAPTYHMLEIRKEAGLWTARIIFDV